MNWGQKIVLVMVMFMLFILGLSFAMYRRQGDSLTEVDYYEKGLEFDREYEMEQNALDTNLRADVNLVDSALVLTFKAAAYYKIKLQRPSNSKLDSIYEGKTTGRLQPVTIPIAHLAKGRWFMEVQWKTAGKPFGFKQHITLP